MLRVTPDVERVTANEVVTAIDKSMGAQAWFLDDQLVCVWGIRPFSLLARQGFLWMVTTRAAEECPFTFARHSKIEIDRVMPAYDLLYGLVRPQYHRSQRWLKWLGFEILPSTVFHGERMLPFRRTA